MTTNNAWDSTLPVGVASGGTGLTTITDGGIMLGSGTGAVTVTAQPTNGQLLVGSTGVDPVLATLTAGSNISIANGAGTITISATVPPNIYSVTALDNTDSPYTVLTTDYYMSCDVSLGVLTIRLPDNPATGTNYIVKDATGNAATRNITVTTVTGAALIDSATTFVMNTAYEAANFLYNGVYYEVF